MKKTYWFSLLLALFGAVAGAVQISYIPSNNAKAFTYALPVLMLLIVYFSYRLQKKDENAIKALSGAISFDSDPYVEKAMTEAEGRELLELDTGVFPNQHVDIENGISWWKKYNKTVFCLKKEGEILGYVSFWPLSKTSYYDFINGRRLENQINSRCIKPPSNKAGSETWWYIGGIVLVPRIRRTRLVKTLVTGAIDMWIDELPKQSKVNVCALAYSSQGESLLKKFGFSRFSTRERSPHKLPVYVKEFLKEEKLIELNNILGAKGKPLE